MSDKVKRVHPVLEGLGGKILGPGATDLVAEAKARQEARRNKQRDVPLSNESGKVDPRIAGLKKAAKFKDGH